MNNFYCLQRDTDKNSNDMKDKIDDIVYNLELGCIDWQEASKQLFALTDVVKSFTAEEVVNELKENETLDDAISFYNNQK